MACSNLTLTIYYRIYLDVFVSRHIFAYSSHYLLINLRKNILIYVLLMYSFFLLLKAIINWIAFVTKEFAIADITASASKAQINHMTFVLKNSPILEII